MAELTDIVESLKLERDWEHCNKLSKKVECFYTIRKNELRYVVFKIPHDPDCRLRIIGPKGKTETYIGEPIDKLYKLLAENFECSEDDAEKNLERIYQSAMERLNRK